MFGAPDTIRTCDLCLWRATVTLVSSAHPSVVVPIRGDSEHVILYLWDVSAKTGTLGSAQRAWQSSARLVQSFLKRSARQCRLHPGYWRKGRRAGVALQDVLTAQPIGPRAGAACCIWLLWLAVPGLSGFHSMAT
jgi:hypothetical protein